MPLECLVTILFLRSSTLRVIQLRVRAMHAFGLRVLEVLPNIGGVQQRLGRNAAHQQACAAQAHLFLNQGRLQTILAGPHSCRIAARAAPDNSRRRRSFSPSVYRYYMQQIALLALSVCATAAAGRAALGHHQRRPSLLRRGHRPRDRPHHRPENYPLRNSKRPAPNSRTPSFSITSPTSSSTAPGPTPLMTSPSQSQKMNNYFPCVLMDLGSTPRHFETTSNKTCRCMPTAFPARKASWAVTALPFRNSFPKMPLSPSK